MSNLGEGLFEKAYEKAHERAEKEKAKAIAVNLISEGDLPDEKIAKVTGLSMQEIMELKELQPV